MTETILAKRRLESESLKIRQLKNMEYLVRVRMAECTAEAGRVIDGHISISDFAGAGMALIAPANLKVFQQMNAIYSEHYPELNQRILVVNAPLIMGVLYKALSVFMDAGTREKVKFVGVKDLAAEIDLKVLPKAYGATRPEADGYMTSRDDGPWTALHAPPGMQIPCD